MRTSTDRLVVQSDWSQPNLLQIAVLKDAAVEDPPVCIDPVRMVRAAWAVAFSSEEETMKISPSSSRPNISMKKGVATRAISTAAAPPLARANRSACVRRRTARPFARAEMLMTPSIIGQP